MKRWTIGIALLAGCAAGLIFHERTLFLGELGSLMVKILKVLATPLIFFAIVDTLSSTPFPKRKGGKLILISLCNALVAAGIAIGVSHLWPAGRLISLDNLQGIIGKPEIHPPVEGLQFSSLFARPGLGTLSGNQTLNVVLFAVFVGVVCKKLQNPAAQRFFSKGFKFLNLVLGWVVKLVPIAVFGVVAKAVGTSGLRVFAALGVFVAIIVVGMAIHVAGYYSVLLKVFTRKSPRLFFRQAGRPLSTAFATGSSLATLPVTLETLDQEMGVSTSSARLSACIGTNLNHDGILLYEAAAALFIAQIYGMSLGAETQFRVALSSAIAAVGIAGIPEAGLITLSLVLSAVGLPLTAVPFLLPVDWLIGRFRATVNVASDLVVAHLLDA